MAVLVCQCTLLRRLVGPQNFAPIRALLPALELAYATPKPTGKPPTRWPAGGSVLAKLCAPAPPGLCCSAVPTTNLKEVQGARTGPITCCAHWAPSLLVGSPIRDSEALDQAFGDERCNDVWLCGFEREFLCIDNFGSLNPSGLWHFASPTTARACPKGKQPPEARCPALLARPLR